jgi:thiol-disulfide isomerase/thioredoxin
MVVQRLPNRAEEEKAKAATKAAAGKQRKRGWFDIAKIAPWIFGLLAIVAISSFFNKTEPVPAVTELTDATFEAYIKSHPDGVLVDFFTPGCPHCVKLEPDFEAAAKTLQAKKVNAPFASLDAKAHPATAKKLELDRYPTVLWFRRGERVLELPPQSRAADKIVEYVEWALGPAMAEFGTEAEFEDALPELRKAMPAEGPKMIVGFGGQEGAHPTLQLTAERFRGKNVFIYVAEKSSSGAVLRAFGNDAAGDQEYRDALEGKAMEEWVKKQGKPPAKPPAEAEAEKEA